MYSLSSTSIFLLIAVLAKFDGTTAQSKGQCGVTYVEPTAMKVTRIVGGNEAKINSYPWMAGVMKQIGRKPQDIMHGCGATLIRVSDTVNASDILITAAHCFDANPSHILLGAHSTNMEKAPLPGQQMVEIDQAIAHSGYTEVPVVNDIGIIKLKKPVTFTQTIQPACLPAAGEQVPDNTPGIIAGWGLLKENDDDYPENLQQAVVPVFNTQECINKLFKKIDAKTQLCAGFQAGGIDTCSEDSGGPYVMKNSDKRYVVQGIVSYGIGCARANRPGVYTRVSGYINWINDQIKALTAVPKKP